MSSATDFSRLLSSFFTDRLMRQLQASPHTIASYRDTFRRLVRYALRELHKQPANLELDDLDSEFLGRFLSHLETERGNDTRTRNARLAAIRSFFGYLALQEPQHAALAGRVVSLPAKRYTRRPVDFLERGEVEALLRAPDTCTRAGRRDRTLLLVAVQTGLRASELIGLRCENVQLSAAGAGAHVRCQGKGRKQRCTPLRKDAAQALRAWLEERNGSPQEPVFPNSRGRELSHDGLAYILDKHVAVARRTCPSLRNKRVTPHVLRHTTAMELLRSGVDCAVIALWLGHESVETTSVYLHADLQLKQEAMAKTSPAGLPPHRYQPNDEVLAFLDSL
jgi:site-specific recombinase XerD